MHAFLNKTFLPLAIFSWFGYNGGAQLSAQNNHGSNAPTMDAPADNNDIMFQIDRIEPHNQQDKITALLLIRDSDGNNINKDLKSDKTMFSVKEYKQGEPPIDNHFEIPSLSRSDNSAATASPVYDTKPMKVLFLIDASGSMKKGEKIENAILAVKQALQVDALPAGSSSLAYFANNISQTQPIDLNTISAAGNELIQEVNKNEDTDLYRALREKIKELQSFNGRKVLILLTDGKDDIRKNPNYKGRNALAPVRPDEVIQLIASMDSTFQIFPVGIGTDANQSFLQSLSNASKNTSDSYSFGLAPKDIGKQFTRIASSLSSNFAIDIYPDNRTFGAEEHVLEITFKYNNKKYIARKNFVLGSSTNTIYFTQNGEADNPWKVLPVGLLLVALMLGVFAVFTPLYRDYLFKKKYVRRYGNIKVDKVSRIDPVTQLPIEDNEDVVVFGSKMITLTSWKHPLSHLVRDEEFPQVVAEGLGMSTGFDFFTQRGINQRLNWLWFGALGGLFGWLLMTILNMMAGASYASFFSFLDQGSKQISIEIAKQSMAGIGLGSMIVLCLAIVEERGQSRSFSINRILIRLAIAIPSCYVLFILQELLVTFLIPVEYLGGLVAWSFFGGCLGFLVSVRSSIIMSKGLTGGLIAGAIAYQLFYVFSLPFFITVLGSSMCSMLGMITYGCILGLTINLVVRSLQDFDIQYLKPKEFSGRMVNIGKWLANNERTHISMGTDKSCDVFIKWQDEKVKAEHARFSHENGVVKIEPLEEMTINGIPIAIGKKYTLQNGDEIGLGDFSLVKFVTKAKDPMSPDQPLPPNRPIVRTPINVPRKDRAEVKKQIVIRPKNQ